MTYLGHTISKDGINADANKIRAITEMPMPEDKKAVQRLLGISTMSENPSQILHR